MPKITLSFLPFLLFIVVLSIISVATSSTAHAQWTLTGLAPDTVMCVCTTDSGLFAGTADEGMYRSTDNGKNWTNASTGLATFTTYFGVVFYQGINAVVTSGGNLIAGMLGCGAYLSTDDGTTWSIVSGISNQAIVQSLIVNDSVVFAGTGTGIYQSTDNGAHWQRNGLQDSSVNAFAADAGYLYAGTSYGGIYSSTDNGATWNAIDSGLTKGAFVNALAVSGGYEFAGTLQNGIYQSTNNGGNWSLSTNIPTGYQFTRAFAVISGNVFAGTDNGVFLSQDSGAHWSAINTGFVDTLDDTMITSLAIDDSFLVAGMYGGGVWRRALADFGISVPKSITHPPLIAVHPPLFDTVAVNGSKTLPLVMTNVSKTIDTITSFKMLGSYSGNYTVKGNPLSNILPGATDSIQLTFTPTTQGPEGIVVEIISNKTDTTFTNIYGAGGTSTSVSETNSGLNTHLYLSPAYPNPFSSATTLDFSLPSSANVILKVYNALGEEVTTLINGSMDAGQHNVIFHGENLQNGMYFYRLAAGKAAQSGMMTVIH